MLLFLVCFINIYHLPQIHSQHYITHYSQIYLAFFPSPLPSSFLLFCFCFIFPFILFVDISKYVYWVRHTRFLFSYTKLAYCICGTVPCFFFCHFLEIALWAYVIFLSLFLACGCHSLFNAVHPPPRPPMIGTWILYSLFCCKNGAMHMSLHIIILGQILGVGSEGPCSLACYCPVSFHCVASVWPPAVSETISL